MTKLLTKKIWEKFDRFERPIPPSIGQNGRFSTRMPCKTTTEKG